ncbi:endopeptidase O, partial [Mycoplasma synoviae GX11-T]|nr:endopeptidase O [Mycoplasmopsis synoviae GX11-T]
ARANVNLMNTDLFHETYQTSEKDKMYLAPEKRIKIW